MWMRLYFAQEWQALALVDIAEERGEEALLEYLLAFMCEEEGELSEELGAGTRDHIYRRGDYALIINYRLPYVGLSVKQRS